MALADSLPGISGGTIAFILGFYDKFIDSFNTLLNGKKGDDRKGAFIFLAKLGSGWIVGMILSVLFISDKDSRNLPFGRYSSPPNGFVASTKRTFSVFFNFLC